MLQNPCDATVFRVPVHSFRARYGVVVSRGRLVANAQEFCDRYDRFCEEAEKLLEKANLDGDRQEKSITGKAFYKMFVQLAAIHFPDDKEFGGRGPRGIICDMHIAVESGRNVLGDTLAIAEIVKSVIKNRPPLDIDTKNNAIEDSDIWEPLKIDRNSTQSQDVIQALEKIIEDIRSNNGYASTEPEERAHILSSLETGLTMIREYMPSKQQIISFIIQPLRYLIQKFSDTAIGETAKTAIRVVINWLSQNP